ncbi:MAG: hypothetical protein R2857_01800 [Vampirovibrionales bacterium]
MVTMQHLLANASVRIKYDIMLILYPMVNWVTVAELCEGWPWRIRPKSRNTCL